MPYPSVKPSNELILALSPSINYVPAVEFDVEEVGVSGRFVGLTNKVGRDFIAMPTAKINDVKAADSDLALHDYDPNPVFPPVTLYGSKPLSIVAKQVTFATETSKSDDPTTLVFAFLKSWIGRLGALFPGYKAEAKYVTSLIPDKSLSFWSHYIMLKGKKDGKDVAFADLWGKRFVAGANTIVILNLDGKKRVLAFATHFIPIFEDDKWDGFLALPMPNFSTLKGPIVQFGTIVWWAYHPGDIDEVSATAMVWGVEGPMLKQVVPIDRTNAFTFEIYKLAGSLAYPYGVDVTDDIGKDASEKFEFERITFDVDPDYAFGVKPKGETGAEALISLLI